MESCSLSDPIEGCVTAQIGDVVIGFVRYGYTNYGVLWLSGIWVQRKYRRDHVALTMCLKLLQEKEATDAGAIAASREGYKLLRKLEDMTKGTVKWFLLDRSKWE